MKSIALFLTLLFSPILFAKTVHLYDQPKADAKMIGSIDSEKGIIPIFTPKDNQWIKVADPRDGNVGWVKTSDLKIDNKGGYTFSEHIVSQGSNGLPSYIVQFGEPKKLTDEQMQEYTKKIKEKQEAIQKDMQRIMQNMFSEFNEITTHFPVIMPVLLVPAQSNNEKPTVKNSNAKDKK